MKIHPLVSIAIVAGLCGCAQPARTAYREPLTTPGGEFSTLPPAVQSSVRTEAGAAEIDSISKQGYGDRTVYQFQFKNRAVNPPLYIASDGSILNSNQTVAVGASADSIAASTGNAVSGLKLDDLPPSVVQVIRHHAPTAEVDSIHRLTSQGNTFYNATFKDPDHHPKLLISDDGHLIQ